MLSMLRSTVKAALNALGYQLRSNRDNPYHNLLGLREYGIRTVVDVGANIGEFARFIRRAYPDAQIVAFEPQPGPLQTLRKLAACDGRITVVPCALGDADEERSMNVHVRHHPSSSLLPTTDLSHQIYPFTAAQSVIAVPVRRLDAMICELNPPVTEEVLVKIDVQGYEAHVIRGGRDLLGKTRACIVEINRVPLYEGQASFVEIVDDLSVLGLEYAGNLSQVHGPDGQVRYFDALFLRRTAE